MVKKRNSTRKPKKEIAERSASEPQESAEPESDEAATSATDDEDAPERAGDDDVVDATFDGPSDDARKPAAQLAARSSADEGEGAEAGEEAEGAAATQLGSARFVIFGWFAAWLTAAYVAHMVIQGVWGSLAHRDWFSRALPSVAAVPYEGELVSRGSISLVLGAVLAAVIVFVYYRKPDMRQWADEVAEQLTKVKWPTRKEVGNNTLIVIAVGAVLTVYLAILDRFWGFITNLIYSSGL